MYVSTLTITAKGQIVLPKKVRNILNTNIITLTINDQNQVVLSPISELGGVLSCYNKNTDLAFAEIREQSWQAQETNHTDSSNISNDITDNSNNNGEQE